MRACGYTGACMRMGARSLANPACNAYAPCYDVICGPLGLHHIFRHYFINGAIFGKKKLLNIKCVCQLSLQLLSKTFPILRRIWRDIVKNVETSSCIVPVILVGFE